jgi:hypothetical protein
VLPHWAVLLCLGADRLARYGNAAVLLLHTRVDVATVSPAQLRSCVPNGEVWRAHAVEVAREITGAAGVGFDRQPGTVTGIQMISGWVLPVERSGVCISA